MTKTYYLCDPSGNVRDGGSCAPIVLSSAVLGVPPFVGGQQLYVRIMRDHADVSLNAISGYIAVKVIGVSDVDDKCFVTIDKSCRY